MHVLKKNTVKTQDMKNLKSNRHYQKNQTVPFKLNKYYK